MVVPGNADLTKAYGFFLLEQYDSALHYYNKVIETDSLNVDAWAGKMNCFLYQEKYDQAINAGIEGLAKKESFLLHHKMAYVYALTNNTGRVAFHFESAIKIPENERGAGSEDVVRSMILSIGNGYYYSGNKKAALKWYTKGKEEYSDGFEFVAAIQKIKESEPVKMNYFFANIHGGRINYAETNFYDRGTFFSVNPSVTIKRKHFISLGYNQSDITLKNNVPFSYVRKMYTDKSTIPVTEQVYVFEDIFAVGGGNYDTVYYADVPVDPKTYEGILPLEEDTYNPENLWTKEIQFQYKLLYSPIKKTTFLAGIRHTLSNMLYSENSLTAYLGHFTTTNTFSIGGLYHYTALDSVNLLQISPNISTINKKLNVDVQTHGIIRLADIDTVISWLPSFQLSLDATVSYHTQRGMVSLTAQTGERAFVTESYGTFFRSSFSPFIMGAKALFEIRPFTFPLTLYYIFSYSKYSEYKSYVNIGGLHIQW